MDEGKAEADDALVVNACCCYIDSCYCKCPQCLGCYGNDTCLCFTSEFKCCKYYESAPGKICLCQEVKCDCVTPTTCCKQINQCCCLDSRCAFPCDDDVPCVCTLFPFFICCQNFACSPKCCAKASSFKRKVKKAEAGLKDDKNEK